MGLVRGWRRVALGVVVALVLGVIGYRVFAPREIIDPVRQPYPPAAVAVPGVYGALLDAPLLLDDRLRVYASKGQVWADQPVDVKSPMSPFWSVRRWPAQVLGVVLVDRMVISWWSDGAVLAIDPPTGRIAWRARVPAGVEAGAQAKAAGRRTGAGTVYRPAGMTTVPGAAVFTGPGGLTALDGGSGQPRWRQPPEDCSGGIFSAPGEVGCLGRGASVRLYNAGTGALIAWPAKVPAGELFGCAPALAQCQGIRHAGRAWLFGAPGSLAEAPQLADPAARLVDGVVVQPQPDGSVTGVPLTGGAGRPWSWSPPPAGEQNTWVIAVEPGAVHVLTAARDLVTLNPIDGTVQSAFWLLIAGNNPFDPGYVYASNRFLFIERLRTGARPAQDDTAYYYPSPAVLLAGT